jgi:3-phenylpropionate/trans-cinnamate dioxygenase ferredoxin subunit
MDTQQSWVFAIEEKKLRENAVSLVFPKGISIMLIKKGGYVYALSNKCAHMACPLAAGTLEGYIMKCPCHDWKFDIRTGEFINANEIKLPVYPVKISDGNILVGVGG